MLPAGQVCRFGTRSPDHGAGQSKSSRYGQEGYRKPALGFGREESPWEKPKQGSAGRRPGCAGLASWWCHVLSRTQAASRSWHLSGAIHRTIDEAVRPVGPACGVRPSSASRSANATWISQPSHLAYSVRRWLRVDTTSSARWPSPLMDALGSQPPSGYPLASPAGSW